MIQQSCILHFVVAHCSSAFTLVCNTCGGAGTQSQKQCRKNWWTGYWLLGSHLDLVPHPVAPSDTKCGAIDMRHQHRLDYGLLERSVSCLFGARLAPSTLRAHQSGYSRYHSPASEPVLHQSKSRHLNGLYAC